MKSRLKYTGATPGADANTYNLFNSTLLGMGEGAISNLQASRFECSIKSVGGAGTLKCYSSQDGGTNWTQVIADIAVPATATGDLSYFLDWLVAEYRDVKVDWVNGGSAQTTWKIDMALTALPTKTT